MTPSQITRSYSNEILLRRWVGAWIDLAVLFLPYILLVYFLPGTLEQNKLADGITLVWLVFLVGYFPAFEYRTGSSLGKRAVGLTVVDEDGLPPTITAVLARTALRLLEGNPFLLLGLPAGLAILATTKRQRFGDMLAGTYVIKLSDYPKLADDYAPPDRDVGSSPQVASGELPHPKGSPTTAVQRHDTWTKAAILITLTAILGGSASIWIGSTSGSSHAAARIFGSVMAQASIAGIALGAYCKLRHIELTWVHFALSYLALFLLLLWLL